MNDMPESPNLQPSSSRRLPPKAIAATGAAVLGGILLALIVLNLPRAETGGTSESPSPSATASASATPSASPAQTAAPTATPEPTPTPPATGAAPMTWTAGTAPGGSVNDIVWIGDRWLAAGSVVEGENRPRAATWTSVDGTTWEPGAPIGPDAVPGPEGMSFYISDVLVLDDELIAFGWNPIGCCDGGKAALWRSTDGVNWTNVVTTGTDYDTYQFPMDAAVAPNGELVLVSGVGLGTGSTVFTSTDGITWVEQNVDQEGIGLARVASSDSRIVAVGNTVSFDTGPVPLVWASADGHSWSVVDAPPGSGELRDITWDQVAGRFVIVGRDDEGRPAVWLTEDATIWGTTTLAPVAGYAESVSAANGLIVASGASGEPSVGEATVWSSFDGITWQVQPFDATVANRTIVETAGERAMLHASSFGPEPDYEPIAIVWAGTLAR